MKPLALLPALALGAALAAPADAQELQFPAASPPAMVRDQVGLTTVEIEYARPSAKGRKIFGGLVPYGQVWRTGANAATRISFDTDVTVGGEPVPAGTYAVFTIPDKDTWTIILNEAPEQWGSYAHDGSKDVLRVDVPVETLSEPVETLRIGFDHLRDDSGHLTLAWENTLVRVPIEVDIVSVLVPRIEEAMAAAGSDKPYLSAAMFYYEHDVDLDKALEWIDAGLEQNPQAPWIMYRKGLIHAKRGDMADAREAALQTITMADGMGGEIGDEYKRLGENLRDSL